MYSLATRWQQPMGLQLFWILRTYLGLAHTQATPAICWTHLSVCLGLLNFRCFCQSG